MKTMKSLLVLLFTICSLHLIARQDTGSSSDMLTYTAYLKNALPLWEKAINEQKKSVDEGSSKKQKLVLAITYYGYLSATMATEDEDAFAKKLNPAKELLEQLMKDYDSWGEPKALLSSIMGLEMAYSPLKGAFLGMKSSSLMGKAMKENPDSPIVMRLYAGSKQYTPAMWGGDKKVAAEYLGKAIAEYEKQNQTTNNWLYADALANLGIVYSEIDETDKAKETFNKALAFEPEFGWVKHSLMPQLAEKGND